VSTRRETIRLALAVAEACWVAPLFLALNQRVFPHQPALLWLGVGVLLLGFSYVYRALAAANLSLRLQQGLLAGFLLLSILFFWRFHVAASVAGLDWLVQPFTRLVDELAVMPGEWIAAFSLVFFWARGIALARRSLSAESVAFSFRLGIVLLAGVALVAHVLADQEISGFIAAYFFFALAAVALARVEEVGSLPNSSPAGFGGFWVGSTVAAVAGLVLVGLVVAAFFYGGGLEQVLRWLQPVWLVLGMAIAAAGALVLLLAERLLALLSIDIGAIGEGFREMLRRLGELATVATPTPPPGASQSRPPLLAATQVIVTVGLPLLVTLVVVLVTWQRLRRARREPGTDAHESLLSARAVARNLLDLLRAGRDRLGELAGLVDRLGASSRFLSAISIRRIYANLVRLATRAGYPRAATQTPFEYLETLYEALPGREAEVRCITQAYVAAHYGQVPDTREELQRIRDCWERVRAVTKT
jgi:hypothetical protein